VHHLLAALGRVPLRQPAALSSRLRSAALQADLPPAGWVCCRSVAERAGQDQLLRVRLGVDLGVGANSHNAGRGLGSRSASARAITARRGAQLPGRPPGSDSFSDRPSQQIRWGRVEQFLVVAIESARALSLDCTSLINRPGALRISESLFPRRSTTATLSEYEHSPVLKWGQNLEALLDLLAVGLGVFAANEYLRCHESISSATLHWKGQRSSVKSQMLRGGAPCCCR
jgi:hypothetical protein